MNYYMLIPVFGFVGMIMLFGLTNNDDNVRNDRDDMMKILQEMDCMEKKAHIEKKNEYADHSNQDARFSTATAMYKEKCIEETGYLENWDDECAVWNPRSGCYLHGRSFPVLDNVKYVPMNWFYIDYETGERMDDPNEFMPKLANRHQSIHESISDVDEFTKIEKANILPLSCLTPIFGDKKLHTYNQYCDYTFTKDGFIVGADQDGDILVGRADNGARHGVTELLELPIFENMVCTAISDPTYSHDCKYYNSDVNIKVRKYAVRDDSWMGET